MAYLDDIYKQLSKDLGGRSDIKIGREYDVDLGRTRVEGDERVSDPFSSAIYVERSRGENRAPERGYVIQDEETNRLGWVNYGNRSNAYWIADQATDKGVVNQNDALSNIIGNTGSNIHNNLQSAFMVNWTGLTPQMRSQMSGLTYLGQGSDSSIIDRVHEMRDQGLDIYRRRGKTFAFGVESTAAGMFPQRERDGETEYGINKIKRFQIQGIGGTTGDAYSGIGNPMQRYTPGVYMEGQLGSESGFLSNRMYDTEKLLGLEGQVEGRRTLGGRTNTRIISAEQAAGLSVGNVYTKPGFSTANMGEGYSHVGSVRDFGNTIGQQSISAHAISVDSLSPMDSGEVAMKYTSLWDKVAMKYRDKGELMEVRDSRLPSFNGEKVDYVSALPGAADLPNKAYNSLLAEKGQTPGQMSSWFADYASGQYKEYQAALSAGTGDEEKWAAMRGAETHMRGMGYDGRHLNGKEAWGNLIGTDGKIKVAGQELLMQGALSWFTGKAEMHTQRNELVSRSQIDTYMRGNLESVMGGLNESTQGRIRETLAGDDLNAIAALYNEHANTGTFKGKEYQRISGLQGINYVDAERDGRTETSLQPATDLNSAEAYMIGEYQRPVIPAKNLEQVRPEGRRDKTTIGMEQLEWMSQARPELGQALTNMFEAGIGRTSAFEMVRSFRANYSPETRQLLEQEQAAQDFNPTMFSKIMSGAMGANPEANEADIMRQSMLDYGERTGGASMRFNTQQGEVILPNPAAAAGAIVEGEEGLPIAGAGKAIGSAMYAAMETGPGMEEDRDRAIYDALSAVESHTQNEGVIKKAQSMEVPTIGGKAQGLSGLPENSVMASLAATARQTGFSREQLLAMTSGQGDQQMMMSLFRNPYSQPAHIGSPMEIKWYEEERRKGNELVRGIANPGDNIYVSQQAMQAQFGDLDGDEVRAMLNWMPGKDGSSVGGNVPGITPGEMRRQSRGHTYSEFDKQVEEHTERSNYETMVAGAQKKLFGGEKGIWKNKEQIYEQFRQEEEVGASQIGIMYNAFLRGARMVGVEASERAGGRDSSIYKKMSESAGSIGSYTYQAPLDRDVVQDQHLQELVGLTQGLYVNQRGANVRPMLQGRNGEKNRPVAPTMGGLAQRVTETLAKVGSDYGDIDPAERDAKEANFRTKLSNDVSMAMLPTDVAARLSEGGQLEERLGQISDEIVMPIRSGEAFNQKRFLELTERGSMQDYAGITGEHSNVEQLPYMLATIYGAAAGRDKTLTDDDSRFPMFKQAAEVFNNARTFGKQASHPTSVEEALAAGGSSQMRAAGVFARAMGATQASDPGLIENLKPMSMREESKPPFPDEVPPFPAQEASAPLPAAPLPGGGGNRGGGPPAPFDVMTPEPEDGQPQSYSGSGGGASLDFDYESMMGAVAGGVEAGMKGQKKDWFPSLQGQESVAAGFRAFEQLNAWRAGDVDLSAKDVLKYNKQMSKLNPMALRQQMSKDKGMFMQAPDFYYQDLAHERGGVGAFAGKLEEIQYAIQPQMMDLVAQAENEGSGRAPQHLDSRDLGKTEAAIRSLTSLTETIGSLAKETEGLDKIQKGQIDTIKNVTKAWDTLETQGEKLGKLVESGTATDAEKTAYQSIKSLQSSMGGDMQKLQGVKADVEFGGRTATYWDNDDERQSRLKEALAKGGFSGAKFRASHKELYEGGLDIGLGMNISDEGTLNAIGTGMRGVKALRGALFAGSMFTRTIAKPAWESAKQYESTEINRESALLQGGAINAEDAMSGALGGYRKREIGMDTFRREMGRQNYLAMSGFMGDLGNETAGRTIGGLQGILTPAIGAAMMGNAMGGPLVGLAAGAAGLVGGAVNYFHGASKDSGNIASIIESQQKDTSIFAQLKDPIGSLALAFAPPDAKKQGAALTRTKNEISKLSGREYHGEVSDSDREMLQSKFGIDASGPQLGQFLNEQQPKNLKEYMQMSTQRDNYLIETGQMSVSSELSQSEKEYKALESYVDARKIEGVSEDIATKQYSFMRAYGETADWKTFESVGKGLGAASIEGWNIESMALQAGSAMGIGVGSEEGIMGMAQEMESYLGNLSPEVNRVLEQARINQSLPKIEQMNRVRRGAGLSQIDWTQFGYQSGRFADDPDRQNGLIAAMTQEGSIRSEDAIYADATNEQFSKDIYKQLWEGDFFGANKYMQQRGQAAKITNAAGVYRSDESHATLAVGMEQSAKELSQSEWGVFSAMGSGDRLALSQNWQRMVGKERDGKTMGVGDAIRYQTMDTETGADAFQYNINMAERGWLSSFAQEHGMEDMTGSLGKVTSREDATNQIRGLQKAQVERQYQNQMAQMNISYQTQTGGSLGIDEKGFALVGDGLKALAEQFEKQGMTLNTGNGMGQWQLEDASTKLRREQQEFGLEQSTKGLGIQQAQFDLSGRQFYEKWDLGMEQFQYNTGYQRSQMQFQRNQQVTQQGWQQEDLDYSRNQSELGFAWQTEDFDRNIRYARGRERRDMMRQRDRAVVSHSMEMGRADTQQGRHDQQVEWANTLFEKQKEHFEQQNQFQLRSMEMQKRHFEEDRALQQQSMAMSQEAHQKQLEWKKEEWELDDQQRLLSRQNAELQFEMQKTMAEAAHQTELEIRGLSEAVQLMDASIQASLQQIQNIDAPIGKIFEALAGGVEGFSNRAGSAISGAFTGAFNSIQSSLSRLMSGLGGVSSSPSNSGSMIPGNGRANGGMVGDEIVQGFAGGGFTGEGMKYEAAGVVHKGEYVVPQGGSLVIRGDGQEALLKEVVRLLQKIADMGPGRVNATIYTNENAVKTSQLSPYDQVMART